MTASTRIIFLSPYDPRDRRKWSGTLHALYEALCNRASAQNVKVGFVSGGFLDFGARILNRILRSYQPMDCRFSKIYAVLAGAWLTIRLALIRDGTIVAVAASNYVSYLVTNKRVIYISDTTFDAIRNLYPEFGKFPIWLQDQGDWNERRSLSKAHLVILPSRWAADSVRLHYGVPDDRVMEIPFGPNIEADLIEKTFRKKETVSATSVTMMFVCTDWVRKNGDLVINSCERLVKRGVEVKLILVGETPEHVRRLPFVDARGWLRKSNAGQREQMCLAYAEAQILLLPTKAEAFGIVYSEAQAFAVPSISCDVGGVSSAIIDGETGSLLAVDAHAEDFADVIQKYLHDPAFYNRVSENCRKRYLTQANWDVWAEHLLNQS